MTIKRVPCRCVQLDAVTDAAEQAIQVLLDHADQCDSWAEQSRSGGWSTHQVEANRKAADSLRREAAYLRGALGGKKL